MDDDMAEAMPPATDLLCLLMIEENILFWNCRGAGRQGFLCEIKDLMKEHRMSIVILFEPRISGVMSDRVCKKFGKKCWIRSEVRGFSGGDWVLWDNAEVNLKLAYDDYIFFTCRLGWRIVMGYHGDLRKPQFFSQEVPLGQT